MKNVSRLITYVSNLKKLLNHYFNNGKIFGTENVHFWDFFLKKYSCLYFMKQLMLRLSWLQFEPSKSLLRRKLSPNRV